MTRPAHQVDYTRMQRAFDTVAGDYGVHPPDTRAEAALNLAMLDHSAAVVEAGGGSARPPRSRLAEVARVLRAGGHLLLAFQSGHGTRDVAVA